MSDIYLYWPDFSVDHLCYCLRNEDQTSNISEGTLADATRFIGSRKFVLILSNRYCAIHNVTLPPTSFAKAQQAAPFALEDQLATELDEVHITVAKPVDDHYTCVVLDRRIMESLAEALKAQQLQPRLVTVDTLCMQRPCSLIADHDGAFVRSPDLTAFVATAMATRVVDQAFSEAQRAEAPYYQVGDAPLPQAGNAKRIEHILQALSVDQAPQEANLMRAQYRPGADLAKTFKSWIRPIALTAACLMVMLIASILNNIKLGSELDQLRAEQLSIYHEVFPDSKGKVIADPARNMRAKLKQLGGNDAASSGLVEQLATITSALSQNNVELRGIYLKKSRMELSIIAPSLASLEKVKSDIESASGREVSLQQVQEIDGKSSARLRLEAAS